MSLHEVWHISESRKVLRLMLKLEALWAISGVWCISVTFQIHQAHSRLICHKWKQNRNVNSESALEVIRNKFFIFVIKIVTYWWWKCLFIQNYASSNLNVNMKINYHIQLSRHDLTAEIFFRYFFIFCCASSREFKIKILEVIKKKICGILSIYIFLLILSFHSHLCACDRHRE